MSRENQFGVISTIAAVLVTVFSVMNFRRGEDDAVAQAYEFSALPFAVILVLLLAFVVFFWLVPLAELLDRPAPFGLGMSALGLLLVLLMFLIRSRLSLDWGSLSGVSIVVSAGGVLFGEAGRKQSVGRGLPHLTIIVGTLAIVVNFVVFALDVLVVELPWS